MKTDNSYFDLKVNLRLANLPDKRPLSVLDCYAGKGLIWRAITDKIGKTSVLSIDKKPHDGYLIGENIKFLKSLSLEQFDVIDLDAYGMPIEQTEILFKKRYVGTVFVTFIQSMIRTLPTKLLLEYGYTEKIIKKCRTLCSKNGIFKYINYLANNGIKHIDAHFMPNCKNYLHFKMEA